MFALTPAERRGVRVVLLILSIGTLRDLVRAKPVPTPAPAPVSGVPRENAAVGLEATEPAAIVPASGTRLDLNRASAAELDRLPGIGPVLASRIVEHRDRHGPFRSPDDLLAVPGIGPALAARLTPLVTVSPAGTR